MSKFNLWAPFRRKAVIYTKEQDDEWVAGIADMEQECVRCEAHYAETVQRLRRAKSAMKERNEDTLSERYHELFKAEAEMFACESSRWTSHDILRAMKEQQERRRNERERQNTCNETQTPYIKANSFFSSLNRYLKKWTA